VDELPRSRAVLLDVTPRQLVKLAGHRLPPSYVEKLQRFRYGPGVFKVDWALSGPIPWRAPACARAGTVHLGGTLEEISASEAAVSRGESPERPYVLLAQHTLFDDSRAPPGQHTGWAYCHVPNGSTEDMTERIEAQVERAAPGFRARILAGTRARPRSTRPTTPSVPASAGRAPSARPAGTPATPAPRRPGPTGSPRPGPLTSRGASYPGGRCFPLARA